MGKPTASSGPLKYKPSSPNVTAKQLPGNRTEYHDPTSNRTVTTNSRGEMTHIKASGLAGTTEISRGPRGERTVVAGRPGARVVSYGAHRGFVERTVRPGYISRTYVGGGRSYAHVFREYRYHDVAYYRYVPAFSRAPLLRMGAHSVGRASAVCTMVRIPGAALVRLLPRLLCSVCDLRVSGFVADGLRDWSEPKPSL